MKADVQSVGFVPLVSADKPKLSQHILEDYIYREYEWIEPETKEVIVYRIDRPTTLFTTLKGKTHRVVDSDGIVHLVPSVGYMGCRIRYKKEEGSPKATF